MTDKALSSVFHPQILYVHGNAICYEFAGPPIGTRALATFEADCPPIAVARLLAEFGEVTETTRPSFFESNEAPHWVVVDTTMDNFVSLLMCGYGVGKGVPVLRLVNLSFDDMVVTRDNQAGLITATYSTVDDLKQIFAETIGAYHPTQ